jgi:hypothetical protein
VKTLLFARAMEPLSEAALRVLLSSEITRLDTVNSLTMRSSFPTQIGFHAPTIAGMETWKNRSLRQCLSTISGRFTERSHRPWLQGWRLKSWNCKSDWMSWVSDLVGHPRISPSHGRTQKSSQNFEIRNRRKKLGRAAASNRVGCYSYWREADHWMIVGSNNGLSLLRGFD